MSENRAPPLFLSLSLRCSISQRRTQTGADQVRISRPLPASRDLHCPSKCVFHDSVDRPLPHTVPPFISPINFDSPQCTSVPRLARSYRTQIGLPTTTKLDLTRSLDGRVITCKNVTTVIKRGIEKRYKKRFGTVILNDGLIPFCTNLEIIFSAKKAHKFLLINITCLFI